jgi:CBS-domain-containing membrane protein
VSEDAVTSPSAPLVPSENAETETRNGAVPALAPDRARRLQRMRVRRALSTPSVAIEADATLLDATRLMDEHHLCFLPVVEGARFVGIVTQEDIEALSALRTVTLRPEKGAKGSS